LIEDGHGGLIVKYIRKIAIPEAIGVPYAADNESSHSSINSDDDSRLTGINQREDGMLT
jgi:hypothetical protein